MTAVLEFRDIVRSFTTGKPVLDGVSFSVAQEEVVALLGRNGAGKTTLMYIALGMLRPQSGAVRLFGLSPFDDPVAVKQRIGYVGELPMLPPNATIPELIALHRKLFPKWDDALATQLLERFELAGNRAKVLKLSKGQAQQVALLCAVSHRPELLLLDEPASGLDPVARREFLEASIQLLNREGTSIVFSSHHISDVERLGGRVVLLDRGKVRLDRSLDDLREQHCVVVIPRSAVADQTSIERLDGCLHVRAMFDNWHAVFRGAPVAVQHRVAQALGIQDVRCTLVPLEELFVGMVGDQRLGDAA